MAIWHTVPRTKSAIRSPFFLPHKANLSNQYHENCCSVDTWDMLSCISGTSDGRFIPRRHPSERSLSCRPDQYLQMLRQFLRSEYVATARIPSMVGLGHGKGIWLVTLLIFGFAKKGSDLATVGAFVPTREALIAKE